MDPLDQPALPEGQIDRLDAGADLPPDWWRFETLLDGLVVDRVVRAAAGPGGKVTVGVTSGVFADLDPGAVVIRLRERWAHLAPEVARRAPLAPDTGHPARRWAVGPPPPRPAIEQARIDFDSVGL